MALNAAVELMGDRTMEKVKELQESMDKNFQDHQVVRGEMSNQAASLKMLVEMAKAEMKALDDARGQE